jgi:hypothetical protein
VIVYVPGKAEAEPDPGVVKGKVRMFVSVVVRVSDPGGTVRNRVLYRYQFLRLVNWTFSAPYTVDVDEMVLPLQTNSNGCSSTVTD